MGKCGTYKNNNYGNNNNNSLTMATVYYNIGSGIPPLMVIID